MTASLTLDDCRRLDAQDPLAPLRQQFVLPEGVIYLDGNSLGVLPKAVPARVAQAVNDEWGIGLIRSWNSAGWFDLPQRLGDKVARLIGAAPNEVVCTDSTSINLYKVMCAALSAMQGSGRRVVLSERSNFPTDLYIAQTLCRERGLHLRLVDAPEALPAAFDGDVAVLMLTHVNYRTGTMHDMAALTRAAHEAGALAVWDLAHSAGAVPVALNECEADFAVGCGYKYLNGGPGAPAFVWVHGRHAGRWEQPLSGWWSHAAPFEFTPAYRPAPGVARYLCGTQPILSFTALECGLDSVLAAEALGGMAALRGKSLALSDAFIALVEQRCPGRFTLVTPREHARRGSQVCLVHENPHAPHSVASLLSEGSLAASGRFERSEANGGGGGQADGGSAAYAIVQALIARGVIGDFRAGDAQMPDILRFGCTPLYLRFADVWHAVEHLFQVLASDEWRRPEFNQRSSVT